MDIHQTTYESFNNFEWLGYELSLLDYDQGTQQVKTLKCGVISGYPKNFCNVVYQRQYTPVLYYISPPVVYSDSEIAFLIDPRNA